MSLKWKGNPRQIIESGLREAMREHIALAADAAEELGEKILKDARALAPVKTGRLRKSGKMFRNRPKRLLNCLTVAPPFPSSRAIARRSPMASMTRSCAFCMCV